MTHSLIVGGTAGMGLTLGRHFLGKGHTVSIIGRRAAPAGDKNKGLHFFPVDVRQEADLAKAVRDVKARGNVDNIVFFQRFRGDGDGDAWANEIAVSLTATRAIIEACADPKETRAPSSIVMVSSIAGEYITEGQPAGYHVAKAGLVQLMRFYAVTLGKRGVRVNCVSPCTTLKDENKDFYTGNAALMELYNAMIPLGRLGTAEDIANIIDFLCSPQASFVTGQNLTIDGGLSLIYPESLARRLVPTPAPAAKT